MACLIESAMSDKRATVVASSCRPLAAALSQAWLAGWWLFSFGITKAASIDPVDRGVSRCPYPLYWTGQLEVTLGLKSITI